MKDHELGADELPAASLAQTRKVCLFELGLNVALKGVWHPFGLELFSEQV